MKRNQVMTKNKNTHFSLSLSHTRTHARTHTQTHTHTHTHTHIHRERSLPKTKRRLCNKVFVIIIIIIIDPLTARVVGAPQIILNSFFSIFPCSPLPSGTCRTPGLSIPWCCFPPLPLSALSSSPFHCALQDGFGQTWWTGNMSIPPCKAQWKREENKVDLLTLFDARGQNPSTYPLPFHLIAVMLYVIVVTALNGS